MEITCGPSHDQRLFKLELPQVISIKNDYLKKFYFKTKNLINNDRIGILVSGGVDSAILYYLLLQENLATGNNFKIIPYTILRKEGSRYYAKNVINFIHDLFALPHTDLNIVGDNTLPEVQQVQSGINDVLHKTVDYIYLGLITAREEHLTGWNRIKFVETFHKKYPLINLEKSHVIDLYIKTNNLELLKLTHSCAINEITPCNECNGCKERQWGLDQLNLKL